MCHTKVGDSLWRQRAEGVRAAEMHLFGHKSIKQALPARTQKSGQKLMAPLCWGCTWYLQHWY
jgi:hypothetical protein